jgi:hypothetical protein
LYKDVKTADPPIKTFLHIFDHCIKPIVLYGCENWSIINVIPGKKNTSIFDSFKDWGVEKLNMKFCKFIMGVSKTCTNVGIYSELGRYPLYIDMLKHFFMYWYSLEYTSSNLLEAALKECKSCTSNSDWYSSLIFYSEKILIYPCVRN